MTWPGGVRDAAAGDLAAVADIYAQAVRDTVATFDLAEPPMEHWTDKLADCGSARGLHLLVAERDGQVLGYASSSAFRPKAAYAATREVSVYVSPQARGLGAAAALYDVLLPRLAADGIHLAVAVVAQPNPASNALHERAGFSVVGTLSEVGRKHGRWVDTRWYQRLL